jgi:hypothetical protein
MRDFVGKLLRNGATVLAQVDNVVLCEWPRSGERQYVTWVIDADGNTYAGHYFGTLEAARNEFTQRVPVLDDDDGYDEPPDYETQLAERERREYEAGKAEAEMRRAERRIYGDELAEQFHLQDDLNRYNRGED